MPYINNETYYGDSANHGEYQYVSLHDLVNNFMLIYVGDDKVINHVKKHEALFHAKRAIQELTYDAHKDVKAMEIEVADTLQMILPPDFVNYVRVSLNIDGVLRPLGENRQVNSARRYVQDANLDVTFDVDGNVVTTDSLVDIKRGELQQYLGPGPFSGCYGWCYENDWYFSYGVGGWYNLEPELANANPTFLINKTSGVINFSSGVANQLIVLEYISDGLQNGDDDSVEVNKMAEEYIYMYMVWAILNTKFGIQEYIIRRYQKLKEAKLRNFKIRNGNLHPGRILQSLRGRDKTIK